MPSAQLQDGQIPALLALTTFSNHIEILNRCSNYEERIFYVLYSAQHHLTYQELRRSIINQTYDSIMSKEKMMNPALLKQYPGAEYMLKDRVLVDFLHIDDEFTVKVGNKNKRIDMVFYHRSLQCLVAEYHRLLVPRDVATRSLAEYCEYLKNTLGY